MKVWWLVSVVALGLLPTAPASASVVAHTVTPASDPGLPGVDVTVAERADGSLLFTITVQPARLPVQPPRLTRRRGASPVEGRWNDPTAVPLVARVVVAGADVPTATITLMRDFGLVGHQYTIPVAAWAQP